MSKRKSGRGDTGNHPISIRMEPWLRDWLAEYAAERCVSKTDLIRDLIMKFWAERRVEHHLTQPFDGSP